MRQAVLRRDRVFADAFVTSAGVGVTGLVPTAKVRRTADGLWWDGVQWGTISTAVTLPPLDATNVPGYYRLDLTPAALDMALGSQGYTVYVTEGTVPYRDAYGITVVDGADEFAVNYEGPPEASSMWATDAAPGRRTRFVFALETEPPAFGKADSFDLVALILAVGTSPSGIHDLTLDGYALPKFVESSAPDGLASTTVTGAPTFAAGAGPSGQDVYDITVADSTAFEVGSYVRASQKGEPGPKLFKLLAKPTSTKLRVHAWSGSMDVLNGDTLVTAEPTGFYNAVLDVTTDNYLGVANPSGTLRLAIRTKVGNGPTWADQASREFEVPVSLDLSQLDFGTG